MENRELTEAEKTQLGKEVAVAQLKKLEAFEMLSREQVVAQGKWLNASLLAVNSAGLIAAMQIEAAARDSWALAAFLVGVGAALLSGAALQEAYLHSNPKRVSIAEPYWREAALTGHRDFKAEEAISEQQKKRSWHDYLTPGLGYLSGLAWISGAIALAF